MQPRDTEAVLRGDLQPEHEGVKLAVVALQRVALVEGMPRHCRAGWRGSLQSWVLDKCALGAGGSGDLPQPREGKDQMRPELGERGESSGDQHGPVALCLLSDLLYPGPVALSLGGEVPRGREGREGVTWEA